MLSAVAELLVVVICMVIDYDVSWCYKLVGKLTNWILDFLRKKNSLCVGVTLAARNRSVESRKLRLCSVLVSTLSRRTSRHSVCCDAGQCLSHGEGEALVELKY